MTENDNALTDKAIRRAAGGREMTSYAGPSNEASEAWFRGMVNRATGRSRPAVEVDEPEEPRRPTGDAGGGPRGRSLSERPDFNRWIRAQADPASTIHDADARAFGRR